MIDRKDLKEKLPYGYAKLAAEKAGVSPQTVSRYLKGVGYNLKVENAILEIISEISKNQKKLLDSIL